MKNGFVSYANETLPVVALSAQGLVVGCFIIAAGMLSLLGMPRSGTHRSRRHAAR